MTKKPSVQELKEAFLNKDRIVRGITEDGFLKIAVVKTTDVVREAKRRHGLSLLSTVLLGRAMTGAMLIAADLKGEERVQVRFEGKGPVGALYVEANHVGEIRGYVKHPQAELNYEEGQTLVDGLGIGLLHFTKTLFNEAQPVTGTVALPYSNITGDFAHYLLNSEQVPSAILLDVGIDEQGEVSESVGILVQALPDAPEEHIATIEKNFEAMEPLSTLIQKGMDIGDLMKHALDPLPCKELKRSPVHFFCRCTKDRFKSLLLTLGADELRTLQDQSQELVCHHCNEHYEITSDEIKALIKELQ